MSEKKKVQKKKTAKKTPVPNDKQKVVKGNKSEAHKCALLIAKAQKQEDPEPLYPNQPMEDFSTIECNDLITYTRGEDGKPKKDVSASVAYLKEYLVPLDSGFFILLKGWSSMDMNHPKVYDLKGRDECRATIWDKLDSLIRTSFNKNSETRTLCCEPQLPFGILSNEQKKGRFFNAFLGFSPENIKKWSSFSKEAREGVEIMKNHIKEVICSGCEKQFIYFMKLLTMAVMGLKPKKLIYLRGEQGAGKSIVLSFLMRYLFGLSVSTYADSDALSGSFNSCLMGMILVVFEEMTTSQGDKNKSLANLKMCGDSDYITIKTKYKNDIMVKNLALYILCSNWAMIGMDGRRAFIPDVSMDRVGQYAYFQKVVKSCYHPTVGKCFKSYLIETFGADIARGKFDEDGEMPQTNSKTPNLNSFDKWLLYNYWKKEKDLKLRPKTMYDDYCQWCLDNRDSVGEYMNQKAVKTLAVNSYGFVQKKTGGREGKGQIYFLLPYEKLQAKAKAKHFEQYDDAFIEDEGEDEKEESELLTLRKRVRELEAQLARQPTEKEEEPTKRPVEKKPVVKKTVEKHTSMFRAVRSFVGSDDESGSDEEDEAPPATVLKKIRNRQNPFNCGNIFAQQK